MSAWNEATGIRKAPILALANDVVFQLFRETRDVWLAWPSKFVPFNAATLGAASGRATQRTHLRTAPRASGGFFGLTIVCIFSDSS
ncbi:MAG: hypothetical protein AB1704_29940 [Pseudomonadota bacterium]|uniref:hypothetical protein n=1 Tax=Burkholderiaceae TaxID=119060 RepID=UPI0010F5DC21|nr:hypothetical protein [Burkholderia sp. 4M9327F10]